MEAVTESIVEREPGRPRRESAMPKGSAGEMAASKAAEVPAATHAATVHAASASDAVATTAAAATTASRERGRRNSNRRSERGRDHATKELVIHLISPWLKCSDGCRRVKPSGDRIDPTISTDKGDRF
jgi:hypothetical protein